MKNLMYIFCFALFCSSCGELRENQAREGDDIQVRVELYKNFFENGLTDRTRTEFSDGYTVGAGIRRIYDNTLRRVEFSVHPKDEEKSYAQRLHWGSNVVWVPAQYRGEECSLVVAWTGGRPGTVLRTFEAIEAHQLLVLGVAPEEEEAVYFGEPPVRQRHYDRR